MTPKKAAVRAPKHLSAASRRWYEDVAGNYQLDPHHLKLLELAGSSWDRAEEARRAMAKGGLTVTDRHGQIKVHPAVNIERDSQIRFSRLLRELRLDSDEPPDPRPPRAGRRD